MKKLWRTLSEVLGKGDTQESEELKFQRMIVPRSSVIKSRPSAATPRLQRRRLMSRTSRRQQSTSGLRQQPTRLRSSLAQHLTSFVSWTRLLYLARERHAWTAVSGVHMQRV